MSSCGKVSLIDSELVLAGFRGVFERVHGFMHETGTEERFWFIVTWLWVKKGYLKNPIGKRKNRPPQLWSPRLAFF